VKRIKENSILWVEGIGFSLLIMLSWLTEAIGIPHLLFNDPFITDWHRAFIRTIVIALVWVWVHVATRKLLKRLHYLEEFLRICSWCRRVCHEREWLELEKYFNSKFATPTSHAMCPECMKKNLELLDASQHPPSIHGT
jgi:hypothetical protein